jgi:hypothetical protein
MRMQALSSAPGAVRMRLHRKRRREGMQYVQIPLHKSEVEDLIRLGVLQRGAAGGCPSAPSRGAYHRLPSTGRGGVIRLSRGL